MWRAWAAHHQSDTTVAVGGGRREWLHRWLATLLDHRDLYADAHDFIADRLKQLGEDAPLRLDRKTPYELKLAFERAQLSDHGLEPDRLCRWLLLRRARGKPLSSCDLVRRQASWLESDSASVADAFRQLAGLLPVASTPALLVTPAASSLKPTCGHGRHVVGDLTTVAEELVQLASRVAELTIGLAVEEPAWDEYVRSAPESFTKAVLGEHVIGLAQLKDVPSFDGTSLLPVARLNGEGHCVIGPQEAVDIGGAAETCEAVAGARCQESAASESHSNEKDPWKSDAERFLFMLLEGTPDLSGRFQLNADPGFKFGNRPAEVDLACLDLKIAVEIDGYFHFQDADSYRRDRRKDLELQRHGFLVIRFLADDVVQEMLTVLRTIRAAVKVRKSDLRTHRHLERRC